MSQVEQIVPIADSVDGACKRLGIGRTTLYQEISAGRLRVRKAGKRTIVPRAEQDRWLNALPEAGAPAETPDLRDLSVSQFEAIVAGASSSK